MTEMGQPKKEELKEVFDFLNACDIAEFGEPDTDLGDLEDSWESMDLDRDAWVLREDGRICGYAAVYGHGDRYTLDLYAHRTSTPAGDEDRLLQVLVARVKEIRAAAAEKLLFVTYTTKGNERINPALQRFGFTAHTWHYRMQIDFDGPCELIAWPAGFSVSPYQEEEEQDLYHLIETAFDWEGHVMPPIEDWRQHLFRNGRYDPNYFLLLHKDGKLVGAALGYNEEPMGWIRQLAVSKDLRGQGIGSMLLRYAFWNFQQGGRNSAGLGVASVNQNACQFYERCGMKRTREFVEYHLD